MSGQSGLPLVKVRASVEGHEERECYINLAHVSTVLVSEMDGQVQLTLHMVAVMGMHQPYAQRVTIVGEGAAKLRDFLERWAQPLDPPRVAGFD